VPVVTPNCCIILDALALIGTVVLAGKRCQFYREKAVIAEGRRQRAGGRRKIIARSEF
jgi:hypothetical protein